MPAPMYDSPTKAQRRKAASLSRHTDLSFAFIERNEDGTATYEGRWQGGSVASIVAVTGAGKVVRCASRTFPENDPPFALIEPVGKHGGGRIPYGYPQFGDEALARRYVSGLENAAGRGS